MRVLRKCGARASLAPLMIHALSVSAFGQAAPTTAQPAQAPATQPVPAQPPVAQPPVAQPPVAQPPVTQPPVVQPPVVQPPVVQPPAGQPAVPAAPSEASAVREQRTNGPTVQLSLDETVKRALEFNLDVQVQRINPRLQDLDIQGVQSVWNPTLNSVIRYTDSTTTPADTLLGRTKFTQDDTFTNTGLSQLLPWFGTSYSIGWDTTRRESSAQSQNFNPSLTSNVAFSVTQPLLRDFSVDGNRTQLLVSRKQREITDVQLQQQVVQTTRQVRNAYWDLVYSRYNLIVAQQSLDLARQTLKDNRTRVEVGTMAPIDIVRAEAEVARNEETAIIAASQIDLFEDNLRRLIFDPASPDYWTANIDLTDQPPYPSDTKDVDIEAAVNVALQQRTDLTQQRKSLEANDINIRYYKNQLLPTVDAFATYSLSGQGGRLVGEIPIEIGWGDLYSDLFGRENPFWRIGVQMSYPLGRSNDKVNLARSRLQYQQDQLVLKDAELRAAAEVRNAGRNVNTNRRRVEAARASRVLSERQLEAEQKKFAVGLSSPFEVVQAQRDLAQARNGELQAIIDYVKSLVDFEAVQQAGTGGVNASGPSGGAGGGGGTGSGGTRSGGTGSGSNTTGQPQGGR
jgi:outer membrane protein